MIPVKLAETFEVLLQMSLYGTIAGCGVCLISVLINHIRAPKWISILLWGLVGLRLICPISMSSSLSLFYLWNFPEKIERTLDLKKIYVGDYRWALEGSPKYEEAVISGSPVILQPYGYYTAYYTQNEDILSPAETLYDTVMPKVACLCFFGTVLLWLRSAISYLTLKYRLQFALKIADDIYVTDQIASPCVVGLLSPRIYLSPNLTDLQMEHILLHERLHRKYFDHLWKILSYLIVSLHWFNPILWVMCRFFQMELEKACDERVLAKLDKEQMKKRNFMETESFLEAKSSIKNEHFREDYSESLLALAKGKNQKRAFCGKLPSPIAFGEGRTKERIKCILHYRKPLATVSLLTVLGACGVFVIFFTTPGSNSGFDLLPMFGQTAQTESVYDSFHDTMSSSISFGNNTKIYADETSMNGRDITELSEAEAQWLGLTTTQLLLQNSGTLYNISHRVGEQNITFLDMDGDETVEKIILEPSPAHQSHIPEEPLQYYRLQIGDDFVEGISDTMDNILWAVSLQGTILLATSESGSGMNPCTHFYRYAENKNGLPLSTGQANSNTNTYSIEEIGRLETDIRSCEIHPEGIITAKLYKEIVQSDYIVVSWQYKDGILEEIPQETYDFTNGNWVELYDPLPLHPQTENAETFMVKPQRVRFLKTSADWHWILIETEDGQQGWVWIDHYEVVELEKNVLDVFAGFYLAG